MNELTMLIAQRDKLFAKIYTIEATYEGIENEDNAQRLQELNLEQATLVATKGELNARLAVVQSRLAELGSEIVRLSGTGIDRILEGIKVQRWFFFKNKPKVLMDKNSGLLWVNLDYFPYGKGNEINTYASSEMANVISSFDFDGISGFRIPDAYELYNMVVDKTFPYCDGDSLTIKKKDYWAITSDGSYYRKYLHSTTSTATSDKSSTSNAHLLPCSSIYVDNSDYVTNISPNHQVYTEKERLQFTLDLFVQNELCPIFKDDELTQIYKNIYFERPALFRQLQDLQTQIDGLQTVALLSSSLDYTVLLAKYDINAIDDSVIKYYQAVQQWTNELLNKLDYYEQAMTAVIIDFNTISLKLSKKQVHNPNLTAEENKLLAGRQRYFQNQFALGMNTVKAKLLAVKKQADEIEYRIEEVNSGDNSIHELAVLEQESRAGFALVAENTATIVKNALLKIEYFQVHHQFVANAIDVWEKWSEAYRIFKTTYREDLKTSCEKDEIEEAVWIKWYANWQNLRFAIEEKIQPIIERGLQVEMPTTQESKMSVAEQIIAVLENYKNSIDKFFLEDRKGIYQKFVFQPGGELQEKFESESELYKCTFDLQSALQDIIFNCKNSADRVFILKWANSLLNVQIEEILEFVADNDLQKISQTILVEFATLKQNNYDIYLTDAKAYTEEKTRREKEYNSLIFKMRKDLMKC